MAIRRGRTEAIELAEEACALAATQSSESDLPMVLPRARLVRARALARLGGDEQVDVDELARQAAALPRLAGGEGRLVVYAPADRLEVALAANDADLAVATARAPFDNDELYRRARRRIEEALTPLARLLADEEHQLIARGYAELASLAQRISGSHRRARNERERDRFRPALEIDLFEVNGLMVAHQLALEGTDATRDQGWREEGL